MAGTTIDALVVTLGLDPSGFTQGQKQAAEALMKTRQASSQAAKEMQADGKRAGEFFSGIKNEALSLIGVLLGGKGIETFAREATKSIAELGRSAANIGVSARELSVFQMMIERNGGSAQAATSSLKGYADAVERFRLMGDPAALVGTQLIGASLDESPLAVYMKFVKFVQDHKNDAHGIQFINQIGSKLGYDQGLVNATIQMGSVAKANEEMAKAGQVWIPTGADIKAVTDMQNGVIGLGQAAEGAGNHLLVDLAPGINAVSAALTGWITKHPKEAEDIAAIATALTVLGAVRVSANMMGLTGLVGAFDGLAALLARVAPILGLLGFTGPAAGEDQAFSDQTNSAYLDDRRNNPSPIWDWIDRHFGAGLGADLAPDIDAEVRKQAAAHGLDPDHMVRLARKEGGGYDKVSSAGAFGPMQLMPATAGMVGVQKGGPWQDNVRGGMQYYAALLRQFNGDYAAADAAYNAGPNSDGVRRFAATGDMSGLPAETRNYVKSIDPGPGPKFDERGRHVSNTSSVTIGTVNVNTQATDARGIAGAIRGAIVNQANTGQN